MSKSSGVARFTRAVITRIVFSFHATVTVWFLTVVKKSTWPWFLLLSQIGILVEVIITLKVNRGHEWKWFCPSVLFYLMSALPPFWLLELHGLDSRIQAADRDMASVSLDVPIATVTPDTVSNATHELTEAFLILGVDDSVWRKVLEQGLLLLLILGRWMLPKGAMTHDQLSQLLLLYMGAAADMAVFYDSFTEPGVQTNRFMSCVILAVWTASLLQFTLVLTEGSGRSDQVSLLTSLEEEDSYSRGCRSSELCGIVISIFLQDLPFLIMRVVLIVRFDVINYTNLFFTAKNGLVIVFLLYRVIVMRSEAGNTSKPGKGVLLAKKGTSNPWVGAYKAEKKSDKARLTESVSPSRSTRPELPLTTFLLTQHGGSVKSRSK